MADDSISVVVVNWNARDELAECLSSLVDQTDRDFEVVVVDNGSVDGSLELVRERFGDVVHLVPTGENLGFAEGCNRGIAVARGRWVLTLNNDATLASDGIAVLRAAAASAGARLGMIQACIRFKDRPRTNSTGLLLFDTGAAIDRDFDVPFAEASAAGDVFCPTAGAALYRRSMLDAIRLSTGWFDRGHFMYCEDLDLGWRARLAGWEARYEPGVVVMHRFQGSSRKKGRGWVERMCRVNRVRTLVKNASPAFLLASWKQTARDARAQWRAEGLGGLSALARAAVDALPRRREVSRRATLRRRAVEQRYARPFVPGPAAPEGAA